MQEYRDTIADAEQVENLLRSGGEKDIQSCHFDNLVFDDRPLTGVSFENCLFTNCKFRNCPIQDGSFSSCTFQRCEIMLADMDQTKLNKVIFRATKLVGLDFSKCHSFGLSLEFEESLIQNCYFGGLRLPGIRIVRCEITESDFVSCGLTESEFSGSKFTNSKFDGCNLEDADFQNCQGYTLNPGRNRVKGLLCNLPEAESFLRYLEIRIV